MAYRHKAPNPLKLAITDRQSRLVWWNQQRIFGSRLLLVGCGALGSNVAKIFTQMGVGGLDMVDHDLAEHSNRNRQLFTADDVGMPKTHAVIRNLTPYAIYRTEFRGYFMTFEQWLKIRRRRAYDVIFCGVDSVPSMIDVARYGIAAKTPVIFTNVSRDGEAARIFIQRVGEACFACYRPETLGSSMPAHQPCIPIPAIADVIQVAVGLGARAAVGEILGMAIGDYNTRDITLSGFNVIKTVKRKPVCPVSLGRRYENVAKVVFGSRAEKNPAISRGQRCRSTARRLGPAARGYPTVPPTVFGHYTAAVKKRLHMKIDGKTAQTSLPVLRAMTEQARLATEYQQSINALIVSEAERRTSSC